MKNPKPEPVVTATACSLCGLNWDDHGDKPTPQTCIDLLRAELITRSRASWTVNPASGTTWLHSGNTGSVTYSTLAAVPPPDDPDMGVPAKVS